MYDSGRFAAISLFCIGTASAFGWLLAYFHIPQLFVDMVSLGRRHHQRRLHHRILLPGDRLFHRRHSGDHHRRHHTLAAGGGVGMHPIHFALIGVISIAYGLVTPPYGLCLMIACTIGGIKIKERSRTR